MCFSVIIEKKNAMLILLFLDRHFETNVNIPKDKLPWASLIETLNKEKMQSWDQREFDAAVDLLRRSLELNPNKRITAEEALKLEFLQID